jgi:hypothetical protein
MKRWLTGSGILGVFVVLAMCLSMAVPTFAWFKTSDSSSNAMSEYSITVKPDSSVTYTYTDAYSKTSIEGSPEYLHEDTGFFEITFTDDQVLKEVNLPELSPTTINVISNGDSTATASIVDDFRLREALPSRIATQTGVASGMSESWLKRRLLQEVIYEPPTLIPTISTSPPVDESVGGRCGWVTENSTKGAVNEIEIVD